MVPTVIGYAKLPRKGYINEFGLALPIGNNKHSIKANTIQKQTHLILSFMTKYETADNTEYGRR